MGPVYDIYADEAWTQTSAPLNRYWCFFGGVLAQQAASDRLETALRKVKAGFGIKREIKWSTLNANNFECCLALLDTFMRAIGSGDIVYRQMFLDRAMVRVPGPDEEPTTDLEVQFKLYYQFLKNAFGLKYLPIADEGTTVLVRLDEHSNAATKQRLITFAERLPLVLDRPDLFVKVTFIESSKSLRLQLCDLLMGAAGSYGNKMHLRRADGRRGMTAKQKLRLEMCKTIYGRFRSLDAELRGSRTFNWFETTGLGGQPTNMLRQHVRIWKFKPSRFQIDKGWQNGQLDRQGRYVASDIAQQIRTAYGQIVEETF